MRRIDWFHKLFFDKSWAIGISTYNGEDVQEIKKKAFEPIYHQNKHMIIADPFIFEDKSNTYLFYEVMDKRTQCGHLCVAEYDGKSFINHKDILTEGFHLSYPNVFSYCGEYYMIPETSQAEQIRLYRARNFPYQWELDTVLADDAKGYLDTSFYQKGEEMLLVTSYHVDERNDVTEVYRLDMDQRRIHQKEGFNFLHPIRGAGNIVEYAGKLIRPVQPKGEYYGMKLELYELTESSEELYCTIQPEDLHFTKHIRYAAGVHTLNRSEHFEVIDFLMWRFTPAKAPKVIFNKIKRRRS